MGCFFAFDNDISLREFQHQILGIFTVPWETTKKLY